MASEMTPEAARLTGACAPLVAVDGERIVCRVCEREIAGATVYAVALHLCGHAVAVAAKEVRDA